MALKNAQYYTIMREYEKKQLKRNSLSDYWNDLCSLFISN